MSIVCAGEVMVEFVSVGSAWQQGFGGDTFNTAIYLARQGQAVEYLTALGDDHFSDNILELLKEESVGTSRVERCSNRQPGLYTIHNQENGEREFSYWRQQSPARELFDHPVSLKQVPDVFYFSGITLAVTRSGLENLKALLVALREKNCRIVFDPNFRARLWPDLNVARDCYQQVLGLCDWVLPTLDDEAALWGIESVETCRKFYSEFGVAELIIKAPGPECHVFCSGQHYQVAAQELAAVDTTGAGDSFNAGYLAARQSGSGVEESIAMAQQLAAKVVMQKGAIIPR